MLGREKKKEKEQSKKKTKKGEKRGRGHFSMCPQVDRRKFPYLLNLAGAVAFAAAAVGNEEEEGAKRTGACIGPDRSVTT